MNYFRTALLLAGLTALFMGVGFLIGGKGGAMIALVVAAGMNLFTYWNSDRMVLSTYGAHEVDRAKRARSLSTRRRAGRPRLPADAARLPDRRGAAQRVCHRPQSGERRGRRLRRPDAAAFARGTRRRHRARTRAYQKSRHAADDHHRDHRRCDLDDRAVRHVLRRPPRQQQRPRHHRLDRDDDRWRRSPPCWCRWRSAARANTPPTISARASAATRCRWPPRLPASRMPRTRSRTTRPSAIPATAHMFIINPLTGRAWTICSRRTRRRENRIAALQALAAEIGGQGGAPIGERAYPPRSPWGGAKRGPWG